LLSCGPSVNFTLPLRQLVTSNAPAYRIRIWDANFLSLPMYNITYTMLNTTTLDLTRIRQPFVVPTDTLYLEMTRYDSLAIVPLRRLTSDDVISNGTLAQWVLLDTQVPLHLNFQIMFRGR
jgi:hypothetical protein